MAEGVGEQTRKLKGFDDGARTTEGFLKNRILNPKPPSCKQRLARFGAAVGLTASAGAIAENQTHAIDNVAAIASDVKSVASDTVNAITSPIGNTNDFIEKHLGTGEPALRPVDKILLGTVEIKTSDELHLRRSPVIPGKSDASNTSDWEGLNIATKKEVIDGRVKYTSQEIKKGNTIVITNPEVVKGQSSEAGAKKGDWLQITVVDEQGNPHARFLNLGEATSSFVKKEITGFVEAKTLQNSGGMQMVTFEKPIPTTSVEIFSAQ